MFLAWRVVAAPTAFAANKGSASVSAFQQRKRRNTQKGVERGEESLKSCVFFFLASESLVSVVNHSQKQVPLMH